MIKPGAVWCCPEPTCRHQLDGLGTSFTCRGPERHQTEIEGGYPRFAPRMPIDKYDATFSEQYAFLWSFGYETLQTGRVEEVYGTVAALAADALAACARTGPLPWTPAAAPAG